jgi:hypothetical protein
MIHVVTWLNLENIMPSERTQLQEISQMITLYVKRDLCEKPKSRFVDTESID